MTKSLLFLDFETEAIGLRPLHYPPKPVGFAFKHKFEGNGYVSWGHPGENSHTFVKAKSMLRTLMNRSEGVVCHNYAFDREVSMVHMNTDHTVWHDTMFLAFLADPYGSMSLKPLAEKHLGMKSEERDAVRDWLVQHGIVRANQKDWGAYICEAPADVVGPYAMGDVERTKKLFAHWKHLVGTEAYKREIELSPCVVDMESQGVGIDTAKLAIDTDVCFALLDGQDAKIRKVLGDVDIDSGADLARALEKKKKLKMDLPLTEKGSVSVDKNSLIECVSDVNLLGTLLMRGALATSVRTFMQPWLEMSVDGRIFFRFNQIRNEGGVGARTGRMSSSPNLMNVPSKWEMIYSTLKAIKFKPEYMLPNMREYIIPDNEDDVILSIDYNQQEMRLFSHFEDGVLMQAYLDNPSMDAHQMIADLADIGRKVAKTLNFAELYGAGLAVIMLWLNCTEMEARAFKHKYRLALPGVKELKDSIESIIQNGKPVITIGGREYHPEEAKMVKGRWRNFNYKLLNYIIQGSAADQVKQAIIEYRYCPYRQGRLLFPVHDELVASVPRANYKEEAEVLGRCMRESFSGILDVPFLTDAKIGENYGNLKSI